MVPDLQARDVTAELVDLDPAGAVDVVLYWQQWRLRSPTLDRVREAVLAAAAGRRPATSPSTPDATPAPAHSTSKASSSTRVRTRRDQQRAEAAEPVGEEEEHRRSVPPAPRREPGRCTLRSRQAGPVPRDHPVRGPLPRYGDRRSGLARLRSVSPAPERLAARRRRAAPARRYDPGPADPFPPGRPGRPRSRVRPLSGRRTGPHADPRPGRPAAPRPAASSGRSTTPPPLRRPRSRASGKT